MIEYFMTITCHHITIVGKPPPPRTLCGAFVPSFIPIWIAPVVALSLPAATAAATATAAAAAAAATGVRPVVTPWKTAVLQATHAHKV